MPNGTMTGIELAATLNCIRRKYHLQWDVGSVHDVKVCKGRSIHTFCALGMLGYHGARLGGATSAQAIAMVEEYAEAGPGRSARNIPDIPGINDSSTGFMDMIYRLKNEYANKTFAVTDYVRAWTTAAPGFIKEFKKGLYQ
jgi:hypothetical protein